jgi:hypothetical protein
MLCTGDAPEIAARFAADFGVRNRSDRPEFGVPSCGVRFRTQTAGAAGRADGRTGGRARPSQPIADITSASIAIAAKSRVRYEIEKR